MVKGLIVVALLVTGCARQEPIDPDWLNKAFTEHAKQACMENQPAGTCE